MRLKLGSPVGFESGLIDHVSWAVVCCLREESTEMYLQPRKLTQRARCCCELCCYVLATTQATAAGLHHPMQGLVAVPQKEAKLLQLMVTLCDDAVAFVCAESLRAVAGDGQVPERDSMPSAGAQLASGDGTEGASNAASAPVLW